MRNNIDYGSVNENNTRKMVDVFREINDIRKIMSEENYYDELDNLYKFQNNNNAKKRKLKKIIAIDLVVMFIISFGIFADYIFAFTGDDEIIDDVQALANVEFEANNNVMVIEDILLENVSILKTKILEKENREIEFQTNYINDDNLPLGEEVVVQEGILGAKNVTIINTYENDDLVDENLIDEVIKKAPIDEIIRVGTSEFLKNKSIHIDDTVYVTSQVTLKEKNNINSQELCDIPKSLEATLLKIEGDWGKVKYDTYEGYILLSNLTSSKANPEILDANRIQKIKLAVNKDMPLNCSSGLTLDDFKRILSNDSRDKYDVFKNAAEDFYNADKNYNVNGVFLASIGIHESAWGTSTIAVNKKNLFGYGAYDASPYESAFTFESYYEGIEILAKSLSKNYLNISGTVLKNGDTATGAYFNGNTVEAVNARYASDKEWHNKVYKYMTQLYNKL